MREVGRLSARVRGYKLKYYAAHLRSSLLRSCMSNVTSWDQFDYVFGARTEVSVRLIVELRRTALKGSVCIRYYRRYIASRRLF